MRRSKAEWSEIVDAFEGSGESHEEFCKRRSLNVGSFRAWLYRLRNARPAGKVARSATPRMLAVRMRGAGALTAPSFVEIAVAGAIVRVATGTDAAYVAELVTELRTRC